MRRKSGRRAGEVNGEATDRVYAAILRFCERNAGVFPTYRQLMRETGLNSTSSIGHHLHMLVIGGKLEYAEDSDGQALRVVGARWIPPEVVESEEPW